ncbi:hypothetical protein K457DRAFT_506138 [Linnemannia elongata AG-77]|uniref:Uncharacterized protein n=1 Tax=Linnemannia elongata AG-77 TaxID=1314771 RepID=A0A197JWC2_9FUNG|nr:hypothetical protein K457DRAFT_506138 [Linnemannia elongata AG-77]
MKLHSHSQKAMMVHKQALFFLYSALFCLLPSFFRPFLFLLFFSQSIPYSITIRPSSSSIHFRAAPVLNILYSPCHTNPC